MFSQPYCSVVPTKAGRKLNAGPKRFPCLTGAFAAALVSEGVIDRRKHASR